MKSLRCICGQVLSANTGEALLLEVERHLEQMLTHAQLLSTDGVALPDRDQFTSSAEHTEEEQ